MTDLLDFDALPDGPPVDTEPTDDLTCEICGKTMNNARGLKMHRTRMHGGTGTETDNKPRSLRKTNLEKELNEFFQMIAMVTMMVNHADGQILLANVERNAQAWSHLANQNKAVRRFLEGMMKTGAIGEVVAATMFTALPILANHGALPPELMRMFGAQMVQDVPAEPERDVA